MSEWISARTPRWVRRVAATWVPLTVSVLLWIVAGGLTPAIYWLALTALWTLLGLVLAFGGLEPLGARLLGWSRPLRLDEAEDLAPVRAALCGVGLGPPRITLRVVPGPRWQTEAMGRRTITLTTGLLFAYRAGRVSAEEVTALLAVSAAQVRDGWTRRQLALELFTLPWDLAGLLVHIVLTPLRGRGQALWHMRHLVMTVTVMHSLQQGDLWLAAGAGMLQALTCLVPRWHRGWTQSMTWAGEQGAVRAGFGPALIAYRRRWTATPERLAHLRRLTRAHNEFLADCQSAAAPSRPAPTARAAVPGRTSLRLVRS